MTTYRDDREHYITLALQSYAECALWTGLNWDDQDESGNPSQLDASYDESDLSDEATADMLGDVTDFITANWELVRDLDPGQTGHDFCLTRNGHGAGFWDRGLGELGDTLTALCKPYGSSDLYVGDDGKLYVS